MESEKVLKSVELFKSGYRCSEAILVAYGEEFGITKETATKIGCSLGGGLGSSGGVCGALSAAVVIIGMKFGRVDIKDKDSMKKTNQVVKKYLKEFKNLYGNLDCNGLIGYDRSTPEGQDLAHENGAFDNCPKFVGEAVSILGKILGS